jgi:hypothetical protein
MTVSVAQIKCHLMVGRLLNDGDDVTRSCVGLLKVLTRHSTWMEENQENRQRGLLVSLPKFQAGIGSFQILYSLLVIFDAMHRSYCQRCKITHRPNTSQSVSA